MSSSRTLVLTGVLASLAGCDARLAHPRALSLLWIVPALLVFLLLSQQRGRRHLERFASRAMLTRLTGTASPLRGWIKAALASVAVGLLLFSLAGLRYGYRWEEIERRGVDLVVAIDVSDSMLVEDAEPGGRLSRLERAKREITDLLRLLQGDRIGLVAFAGTAFVQCPLTLDYGAAALFLDAIEPDVIPVKGTDLAAALETSLGVLQKGGREEGAVILITDGEDHSGRALQLAERAAQAGVRVYAIGIGRDEGAPIPDARGGFRRTRQGEIVISRLDEGTLQKIALATGGAYVRSVSGDIDLERIYTGGIKAVLADQELESQRRQQWEERFQWVLALALPLLMIEPFLTERKAVLDDA